MAQPTILTTLPRPMDFALACGLDNEELPATLELRIQAALFLANHFTTYGQHHIALVHVNTARQLLRNLA